MRRPATHLRKEQIDHLLRAAAAVTNGTSFTMVGSGAAIAQLKHVPLALMMTREVDIYVTDAPDPDAMSDLIDGSIGEGSQFDLTFGYYAHGVGRHTARLPDGWRDRAITMPIPQVPGASFTCPEINDIALSKLCAWREKDISWIRAGLDAGVLDIEAMTSRAATMNDDDAPPAEEVMRRLGVLRARTAQPNPKRMLGSSSTDGGRG